MSFRILNFLRNFSFYLTRTDVFTIIRITSVICNFKIPSGPAFQDSLNYWSLTLNLMMNKTKLIPIHRWHVNSWQQFQHLLLIHLKVLSKQCLKKKKKDLETILFLNYPSSCCLCWSKLTLNRLCRWTQSKHFDGDWPIPESGMVML